MRLPERNLLCLRCGSENHFPEADDPCTDDFLHNDPGCVMPKGCPSCGDTEGVPADLDKTVPLVITEHELRILTMWADNYARSIGSEKVTRTILDRLATYTDAPLSMSQEIADLRATFGDVRTYDANGNETDL